MTIPEIVETVTDQLFMRVAEDAHTYLWVTNNYLPSGLMLMKRIGFRYVTNIAWIKPSIGLGQYFRGQHELALFGVTGRAMVPKPSDRFPSIIEAPKGRHSEKPERIYEIAETISPGPRFELFARALRPGWDAWGNEI
jgi:N6-adenosine-specific RNA methylase IME4